MDKKNRIENRRRNIKARRQQQVRRQLICIGIIILFVICLGVSCGVRSCSKKEEKEAAATKIEEQETSEEKLARVKKEAEEAEYPEKVIELLSKNPETVDFVDNYAKKKDEPCAETIEEFEEGKIPHLLQWDERWGYASYGTSIIAVSGCGPTCMAMVISYLTNDASVTPETLASYGTENNYLTEDNSTQWSFMTEACQNWGVYGKECSIEERQIARELEKGNPIIFSVGPGDFTDNGHYIVLTGYKDGKVMVNDPFSIKNTEKEWVYEDIKDQIKGSWSYSLN